MTDRRGRQVTTGDATPARNRCPVLYVITDTDVGGAERFLDRLVRHLPPPWEPHIVSLAPVGPIGERLRADGYPVVGLDARPRQAPVALRRLLAIASRVRPRLLHSILCHGNLAARALKLLRPTPLLSSIRVAEHGARWQRVAERATWRWSDHLAAVSPRVAHFLRRCGVAARRITVIPNAVEPVSGAVGRESIRLSLQTAPEAAVLLFAGRLHRQKGLDLLLAALPDILRARPDTVLWVAGAGDPAPYQEQAERLGIAVSIRWLGFRTDLTALMQAADLLVLPSRWEGMPNVVLEALACGLPVVATAVEGTTELLRFTQGGILIPPESPPALASAVRRALVDESLRVAARKGGQAYMSRWTVDDEVRAYVRLYHKLCSFMP